jgi:hypothetical protein
VQTGGKGLIRVKYNLVLIADEVSFVVRNSV